MVFCRYRIRLAGALVFDGPVEKGLVLRDAHAAELLVVRRSVNRIAGQLEVTCRNHTAFIRTDRPAACGLVRLLDDLPGKVDFPLESSVAALTNTACSVAEVADTDLDRAALGAAEHLA